MSVFEPNSRHFREVLILCFHLKNSAAEAHRALLSTYGEAAPSEKTCREWFQRFKNGNFDVEDKERSERPEVYEDAELEGLLNKDSCQTQEESPKAKTASSKVTKAAPKKIAKTVSPPKKVSAPKGKKVAKK